MNQREIVKISVTGAGLLGLSSFLRPVQAVIGMRDFFQVQQAADMVKAFKR